MWNLDLETFYKGSQSTSILLFDWVFLSFPRQASLVAIICVMVVMWVCLCTGLCIFVASLILFGVFLTSVWDHIHIRLKTHPYVSTLQLSISATSSTKRWVSKFSHMPWWWNVIGNNCEHKCSGNCIDSSWSTCYLQPSALEAHDPFFWLCACLLRIWALSEYFSSSCSSPKF